MTIDRKQLIQELDDIHGVATLAYEKGRIDSKKKALKDIVEFVEQLIDKYTPPLLERDRPTIVDGARTSNVFR